ncbi:MAG: universal stress protein [Betaproteobacteria bacterium]|nr:universal stress protein [Betaproteobacteria bacterium]
MSNKAVTEAARLAKALGAELLVVHVRSPIEIPHHVEGGALSRLGEGKVMEEIEDEERQLLDDAIDTAASAGVAAKAAFVAGYEPYEAIIRVSREQNCDLIVMASHSRHGLPRLFLGSETQKVLAHTGTPVLVVRRTE